MCTPWPMTIRTIHESDKHTGRTIRDRPTRGESNRTTSSVRRASGGRVAAEPGQEPRDIEVESPKASDRLQEEEAAQDRRHVWLAEQGWSLDQTHERVAKRTTTVSRNETNATTSYWFDKCNKEDNRDIPPPC